MPCASWKLTERFDERAVPTVTSLPERIGRYRVERLLGRGAMGLVCRAYDPDIDRPVAIKLILADLLAGEDRDAYRARFRREAQAAGRCMHPNIVAVYDVSVHEGNPFLVLEYVDGISLREALDQGTRFTPAATAALVMQVLEALSCAHGLGIIHQDIKPANILLLRGGQVKVADFGIARLRGDAEDGIVLGTPSYMSPEQCQGSPLDHRTDVFSTGAVLYELLSGHRAFPGKSYTEVAHRLTQASPPRLHDVMPSLPTALCAVVDRALARDPAARFPSAGAMAAALRAAPTAPPDDGTIVLVSSRAGQPRLGSALGAGTIGTIERRLAQELGPIAKLLVSSAARTAPSLEALCETLSRNIPSQVARERFMADALTGTGRSGNANVTQARATLSGSAPTGSASAGSSLGEHDMEQARQELARYLGPIAKVLVRREAAAARSVPALWERLAAHIEHPADRATFLSRRPLG